MRGKVKCYLDMDGVLADFMKSALKVHGRPELFELPESQGVWETENLLGITASEFWRPIDGTPDFWSGIEKTTEADEIVALAAAIFGRENVAILTAPSLDPKCFTGKARWIKRHYPQYQDRVIYAKSKGFMASPQRVLVDDRDRNIQEFTEAGGMAVQVPRAWNEMHLDQHNVMNTIREQFREYALCQ